jgi:hypothetical protein
MLLEIKILLGIAVIFVVYITVIYLVNKQKAKKLIDSLMIGLEWLAHSEILVSKKDKLYEQFSALIDLYLVRLPFAKIVLKWFVKYAMDKYIESKVPTINSTIAPVIKQVIKAKTEEAIKTGIDLGVSKLTEKIVETPQPSTNNEVIEMAKIVAGSDAKAIYSVFGKITGNTKEEGVDYEVGAGISGKIGGV